MPRYAADSHVLVESLVRQPESDGVLVGRKDLGTFLLLPADAVDVLDDLAAGCTVGEAQLRHRQRHGDTPEMEDFLTSLEQRGFVRPAMPPAGTPADAELHAPPAQAYHFEWIQERWARRLFSTPMLAAGALLIALAMVAMAVEPSIVPGWRAVYFPTKTAAGLLFLMLTGLFTTFLHEMGHLVAARARGVSCRFGIGNQLWFLVWETDMTGIWALPRGKRYLPLLGGPLVDLLSAATLLLIFFVSANGWMVLPPAPLQFGQALLFIYLMRILWQCYFFLRTDFYYALANLLGCRNLMGDTRVFLKNRVARYFRIGTAADESHIPPAERTMVRLYAGIWVAGRGLAFALLIFIQLPLLFHYLALLFSSVKNGTAASTASDPLLPLLAALVFSFFLLAGLGLWIKGLWWPKKGSRT